MCYCVLGKSNYTYLCVHKHKKKFLNCKYFSVEPNSLEFEIFVGLEEGSYHSAVVVDESELGRKQTSNINFPILARVHACFCLNIFNV